MCTPQLPSPGGAQPGPVSSLRPSASGSGWPSRTSAPSSPADRFWHRNDRAQGKWCTVEVAVSSGPWLCRPVPIGSGLLCLNRARLGYGTHSGLLSSSGKGVRENEREREQVSTIAMFWQSFNVDYFFKGRYNEFGSIDNIFAHFP